MASRFWVGGTGTWDGSTTTHWASSTGGAGGQSVPGVNDTVTLDGSSGGGTVTVNTTVTVQSITCGAFTGTLDFSANNNNVTLSAGGTSFNGSGSGTRTINLGNGTWTLSGANATWSIATTTGLTFNANSSTIVLAGNVTNGKAFTGGAGLTYSTITFGPNTSSGAFIIQNSFNISMLNIIGPAIVTFAGLTLTVTTLTITSSISGLVRLVTAGTISMASGAPLISWTGIGDMTFSGGATFTAQNSFNLGNNTGITITPPTMTRSRGWSRFA